MRVLIAAGLAVAGSIALAVAQDGVIATFNPLSGHTSFSVGGIDYLESTEVATRANGRWYSTSDGSLVYDSHTLTSGSDGLGSWNATVTTWKAGSMPFITSVRQYLEGGGEQNDQPFVILEQTWPEGAFNTSFNTSTTRGMDLALSSFPTFVVDSQMSDREGSSLGPRGYLAFSGDMCGYSSEVGLWSNASSIPDGIKGTGPLVVFDKDQTRAVVISPFSQFFTATHQYVPGSSGRQALLRAGPLASLTELPPGYSTSTIVMGGKNSQPGVNAAVRGWGHTMRRAYNKPSDVPDNDFTLRTLQFSTDNGAVYYYNTEPGKNYQDTMVDIAKYAKQQNIPYRTVLYDSWWYPKDSKGAVTEWIPKPQTFPDGFEYLYNQTQWKSIAHNRYWSQETPYAKQNGGDFEFIFSGPFSLPVDTDLWVHIMTDPKGPGATMDVYEQDWLDIQTDRIPALTENATLGRQWLLQMNEGAELAGKHIQMCMSHTRHILQSLEMPTVSQARASGDYASSRNTQWIISLSSMLAHAVGIAPTKDNAWSETEQPLAENKYHDNRTEPRHRLESAVLSLSRGPVAFSDQIGHSNRSIIMATCREDGILLRPDRPATLVDKIIGNRAFQTAEATLPDGEVTSTVSSVSREMRFGHVLSVNLSAPVALTPADAGLDIIPSHGWVAVEHNSTDKLVQVDDAHPLQLSPSDQYSFQLFHLSPIYDDGWTLLGELGKWVPTSSDRFHAWRANPDFASVDLQGAPGEQVTVSFAKEMKRVDVQCTFGATGRLTATVPQGTCVDPGQ